MEVNLKGRREALCRIKDTYSIGGIHPVTLAKVTSLTNTTPTVLQPFARDRNGLGRRHITSTFVSHG